ncbi:MAG: D-alanine--D-alanine ligase [Armatimonadota bacterium]|nr:D-alanine--D-alanine ligase [Armatimonadota bacterium]MDR7401719.1 D-alanine--D-alanine ligase [Armatimonadota bacterium]MDR7404164.1 D-alanine--D-alanine ligase [Armatimonadota bacterium]MDR7436271.1 D-alanine--D-alanine ligase [Armatimonadota bacterium]MDR7471349.1 D-alanine--D-alanine ligase [Armatimonadota bacterium]
MSRLTVAVLMGGPSAEREVSLATGREVIRALDPARYDVVPVEITASGRWVVRGDGNAGTREPGADAPTPDAGSRIPDLSPRAPDPGIERALLSRRVDVAFIALHGPYGEDGTVQGLLELLGIPYTGSGVLASALGMDKWRSRQLFERQGIPVPRYLSVREDDWRDRARVRRLVGDSLGYPCVVKPNAQGSTIGVSLVRRPADLDRAVDLAFGYGPVVLIEEYVAGTEITVGILDDPETGRPVPLPVIEIVPHDEFYTYRAKYAPGGSDHVIPARVPEAVARRAQEAAVRAHQALGCEGMSRVDMIARGEDAVVLEVNTIPGLTPTSLLPDAARAAGIAFPSLVDRIIRCALRRARRSGPRGREPA